MPLSEEPMSKLDQSAGTSVWASDSPYVLRTLATISGPRPLLSPEASASSTGTVASDSTGLGSTESDAAAAGSGGSASSAAASSLWPSSEAFSFEVGSPSALTREYGLFRTPVREDVNAWRQSGP